jgi:hypothetical protein
LNLETPGPDLTLLTRRLAETPADFFDEPRINDNGQLAVAALVNDLLHKFGRRADMQELRPFTGESQRDRNRLQLVALATWLLAHEDFKRAAVISDAILPVLTKSVAELAASTRADKCINDAERREEFVRFILARLQLRPGGETRAQASDRLAALSSTERQRLLQESRDAERRARDIREALARKAAQESADKWTRE